MRLEQKVIKALIDRKNTLSVAESCTGGLLAHRLTNIPGSSDAFDLGIVTYSNDAKEALLKVPAPLIKRFGAVSEAVALAMAKGVRKIHKSDFGISITGIAGPTGSSARKPIGLTFIALCTPAEALCLKCVFKGSRLSIKSQAATQALNLLLEFLQ